MSEVDMGVINDEPEDGVTATFELKKGDKVTKVTVEAPSHIAVARALHHLAKPEQINAYLVGVSDPDGWEDLPETEVKEG